MENQTLLYVMTGFVILAGLSMLCQALAMVGLYRKVREIQERATPLIPRAEQLLENARTTLEQSRAQMQEISTKTNSILDSTRVQLVRVEEVVADASQKARVQLEKAQIVMDDTMSRVHETVAMVHGGVVKPLREINGLVSGVRAGFSALVKSPKGPSVATVTQDEEMFI
jgi:hypothetical protein